MKVLLVSPPHSSAVESVLGGASPPLGLAYVASSLEEDGHEVRIVDSRAMGYGLSQIKREISSFYPDVVGLTATTPAIYSAYKVADVAKQVSRDTKVVLGGSHASFMAEDVLRECPSIDFVVRGEGEETVRELLRSIEDPKKVLGITYRERGVIKSTPNRLLIKSLDDLPVPAYHLLPMDRYRADGIRYGVLLTSRGCPFSCIFCCSSRLMGKVWRGHSEERVLHELTLLRDRYGVKEVEFLDDTFTLNKKRAKRICEEIVRNRLDVSWSCSSRADLLDEELANALKNAGCHTVYIGAESGVQETLNFLKKGVSLGQIARAVEVAKRACLNVVASFIIGIPGETREKIRATIEFAKKLKPTFVQFTLLTPFPGTEIYEYAEKRGLLLTKNWLKYTTLDPVMKIRGLSSRELKRLLREAYLSFYLRPKYFVKTVARFKAYWAKTLLRGVVANLRGCLQEVWS